ncbi:MAG: amidase family protein [Pseudomonadota bacterium]
MGNPCDLSAVEARRLIGEKALSPVELFDACLARIEAVDPSLNAVVAKDVAVGRAQAQQAEKAVGDGTDLGLLHGLPVGVKDLENVAGLRTTFGSLLYEHNVSEADDAMVANLRAAGAVLFAKTNTPEFGAGANTKNRVYGATGNPFDPEKTCAGSSGGSAVALATGMMPLATGSDYGGSLRTPAAFCGVVGFRPSPGLVPKVERGISLNPFGVLGPMARTVDDVYLLLRAQADLNRRDPFSSADAHALSAKLEAADLGSLRLAWSVDLGCATVASDVRATFLDRLPLFRSAFQSSFERDPFDDSIHESFEVLRGVNFVGPFKELVENERDRLGPNVIDNTERGLGYSLADVAAAHVTQTRIFDDYLDLYQDADILICPAAAVSPFPHANLSVTEIDGTPMPTYMRWLAPVYALTMGLPAVCVIPCGVDHSGMPFGIQVAGPKGSDMKVLAVAKSLEALLAGIEAGARPLPDLEALSS